MKLSEVPRRVEPARDLTAAGVRVRASITDTISSSSRTLQSSHDLAQQHSPIPASWALDACMATSGLGSDLPCF